jgi:hypothetical protein
MFIIFASTTNQKRKELIMPRGNRRGPEGAGPMTGRAMGYCAGYSVPGYANRSPEPGAGRGMGRRNARGFGQGYRRRFYHPDEPVEELAPTREEELNALKTQAERLQRTLDEVNRRIKDLEE